MVLLFILGSNLGGVGPVGSSGGRQKGVVGGVGLNPEPFSFFIKRQRCRACNQYASESASRNGTCLQGHALQAEGAIVPVNPTILKESLPAVANLNLDRSHQIREQVRISLKHTYRKTHKHTRVASCRAFWYQFLRRC